MHNRLSRWALSGGAAVAALGLVLPTAPVATAQDSAAATHGKTRVAIARPVYRLLGSAGIAVEPTGAATAGAFRGTAAAKFPITKIRQHQQLFLHKGGLRFSTGDASIRTRRFTVSTAKNRVTGLVNGSEIGDAGRVVLFTLHATNRPRLGDVRLELTRGAARALDVTFGVHAFSKGDTFGYATVRPR